MIKTDVFSLEKLSRNYLFAADRCRLVLNGQPQPSLLHGEQIDLQLAFGEHTLLATSYDYFDGCQHWLYLVCRDGRIVDGIRMPDEFGFLQDLTTISEDQIAFGYFVGPTTDGICRYIKSDCDVTQLLSP
jgi:hypothetical protein